MDELISLGEKIIPEGMDLLKRRYSLLRTIAHSQPIGRRALSRTLYLPERTVRGETDFLTAGGMVSVHTTGIVITDEGLHILERLENIMKDLSGIEDLSEKVREATGFKSVYIARGGDSSETFYDIGKMAAQYFLKTLKRDSVVALTGGSTVRAMTEMIRTHRTYPGVMVVPARGGMGRNFEIQSDTLAERLAEKLSAGYRLLNVPETLSEASRRSILKEKEISETVSVMKKADIVVAGIGRSDTMAKRRGLDEEEGLELKKNGALGEFFGSYFDRDRKIVKQNKAVGLNISDIEKVRELLVLAGGEEKAEAILSVYTGNQDAVLFTDEACARKIAKIKQEEELMK